MTTATTKKKKNTPLRRRLKWWYRQKYWAFIAHIDPRAWLHHLVDNDPFGEYDEEAEELLIMESEIWRKRAYRVHIGVSDIPLPEGKTNHWISSRYQEYESYLDWQTLRKFKRLVEEAEHLRRKRRQEVGGEYVLKWLTFLAAATGAGVGIYNLLHKP